MNTDRRPRPPAGMGSARIPELGVVVTFVPGPRARRYILRVPSHEEVRCTVPRRGSMAEAMRFVRANSTWIAAQINRRKLAPPPPPRTWADGHSILYRGEKARIHFAAEEGVVLFGDQIVPCRGAPGDFRSIVEQRLRMLAMHELPQRTREMAASHALQVLRVSVRSQRSRWGSCSRSGTISLNWRLVQTPQLVRDYVIVHELMHLRHMNHSAAFWNAVELAFPEWKQAEAWLKAQTDLLRM